MGVKSKNPLAEVVETEQIDSTVIKGKDPDYDYHHVRVDKLRGGIDPVRGWKVVPKDEIDVPYTPDIADGDFHQQFDTIACKRPKSIGEKIREKQRIKKDNIRAILSRGEQIGTDVRKLSTPFYIKQSEVE